MTVRTAQYLKDGWGDTDPFDYNVDLVDTFSLNSMLVAGATPYYVDSTSSAASDTNPGTDPAAPLATIDGAFALSLAAGDIVYVMPGHNEGLADAQIDLDIAGVFVIGLGSGKNRPRIDFDHANASINIGAIDITLAGIRLQPSVTGVLIGVDVEAAVTGSHIACELMTGEDGAGVDEFVAGIEVKAGCHDTVINNIVANSHASSAPVAAIRFAGASNRCKVGNVWAYGPYSTAAVNNTVAACLNMELSNMSLKAADGQPGIEMVAGTTGHISDVYIASTGLAFSDMIVAAGMEWFNVRGVTADGEPDGPIGTATASWRLAISDWDFATDTGAQAAYTVFTVTGHVMLQIFGICDDALTGAAATIELGVTGNTAIFIAQATGADLIANEIWHDATPTTTVEQIDVDGTRTFIVANGQDIDFLIATADLTAGTVGFYCLWKPLSAGSSVVAA